MKIVSIIVTYNALKNNWLYKCLDSLISSELETTIIVIDNGSKDETCTVVKEKYPFVKLIENSENKGFGAANNQGFEYGITINADYFFLLNQDAYLFESTIDKLVEIAQKYPDYGIISPLHLNGNGSALDYKFSNYIVPTKCQGLISDVFLNTIKEGVYEVNFVNAAGWLVSRACLENVGGFNPSFFHYGEDDNYIHRAYFHGFKVGILPSTKICHDREERANNIYFDESLAIYKRTTILKLSNPLLHFSFDLEYKKLYKTGAKAILLFNFKEFRVVLNKIKVLKSLDKKQIEENKIISMSTNSAFLNE